MKFGYTTHQPDSDYDDHYIKIFDTDNRDHIVLLKGLSERHAQQITGYLRNVTNDIEKTKIRPLQRMHDDMVSVLKSTGANLIKCAKAYEPHKPKQSREDADARRPDSMRVDK